MYFDRYRYRDVDTNICFNDYFLNICCIGHGTEVQIGCQTCRCNDGELLCSKESCGIDFNQHNSGKN